MSESQSRRTLRASASSLLLAFSVLAGLAVLLRPSADRTAANPLADVDTIAGGAGHTCAVTHDGSVWCWGWNQSGQLGDGTTVDRPFPVHVQGLTGTVTQLAAGAAHNCALMQSGHVECWGLNAWGQLGSATGTCPSGLACSTAPVEMANLTHVALHTCAITTTGVLKCWGDDYYGQLGTQTSEICPFSGAPCSTLPLDVMLSPKQTPTPTPTSTATPASTPLPPTGDADCSGTVNAIDAALVLQYVAGLLGWQPCFAFADVNRDGAIDAIDAALILQYVAGLLHSLPV